MIKKKTWIKFVAVSIVAFCVWFKFSYPQLVFVSHKVGRESALQSAHQYLQDAGYDVSAFKQAIVFSLDIPANQYLQKTIGFEGLKEFTQKYDFDLFIWLVRFFKEQDNEEYRLAVSATTGDIISFNHIIDDGAVRDIVPKEVARETAVKFLENRFGFNFNDYSVKGDFLTVKDNREDYSFSWRKNDVDIPWSDEENSGRAKLLMGATVSGQELLSFSKNTFKVPAQFNRYIAKLKNTGWNLNSIVVVLYTFLFMCSVYFLLVKRNHLSMHLTKKFYIQLAVISFVLSFVANLNYFQEILFNYTTTSPFRDYIMRLFLGSLRSAIFVNFAVIMPSLSGELLHYESFKEKKEGSFFYYITTTFFSRSVAGLVLLGYLVMILMLGIQSSLIAFGQKYLGVWVEYSWLGHLSTAYFPFIAAFSIGYKASIQEELMFRLFAISWGKKVFKSTLIAVIFSSLVWGFAHSSYPVFPMWFRGVEVTFLGFFMAFMYLRYGIIPVIIGHFLFDAFWRSSGHLLGSNYNSDFYSAVFVLSLPLIWAVVAWIKNEKVEEKSLSWKLSKKQLFNLEILKYYLIHHKEWLENKAKAQAIDDIASNGWDIAVVEIALEEFYPEEP